MITTFLDWLVVKLQVMLAYDPLYAAIMSLLLGIVATEAIVRMFPATYSTFYAQRLLRLIVGGITLCTAFYLQPTPRGMIVAAICALAAPTLHDLAFNWLYARFPAIKPPVLKDPGDP
jgi:hypothetical protein